MDLRSQLQATLGSAYTLERELGGGGMSRVFVAEETSLGRRVVVKVLPPDLTAGVNVDRFKREIQVAAKLQHAHIVPVLAAGEMNGVPYYTMPFVDGESLRALVRRSGPLPITEAIGVLRDVAKALAYAHDHGVVHRDIKPDNVMVAGGSAMVVDFGIAKAISAARNAAPGATLTQIGTSIGTPTYMAPEQAAGDPATDHRADLYAFGCMAYETFTGRPPFTATSPHKLMAAHMSETPEHVATLRPDTPAPLAALVMRCLEKDAGNRPASATEIVHVLDTVTSGGGLPVMPAILIGGPAMFKRALLLYAVAFALVAIVTKAAIVAIGLPDWVFPGSMVVMTLGLPVILFTGYVHHTTRRLVTMTPQLTPGGTPSMAQGTMQTLAIKVSPHVSWRRTTLGGAYALGAFILLVGAFMLLRALGIGPTGSLLAAGKIAAREPLLVTDFKVTNADSSLGRVLSDAAKSTLAQSSVISLATPEAIAGALRRMQRPPNSTVGFDLARELALRNNIKAIVDGEVTGLGAAGFIVTLKLVTTDSARELASFRQTAGDARGLIEAVDKLSRSLRERVGESLRSVRATLPIFDATTSSLEALRKFTEGARIAELEANNDKAIPLLREAVTIDSTFAAGWRKLAIVMSNAGRPRSSIDSALTNAYQHRHRLGDAERDYVVAAYYGNGPGRDRAKAIAAYESMLRRGDTAGPANNLALRLVTRREYARAESLYRAQERVSPGSFRLLYGNLAGALARQRKLAEVESVYAAGLARFPDAAPYSRNRLSIYYLKGDTAGFRRVVDSMLTRGDSADRAWAQGGAQLLALRDGRIAQWRRSFAVNRPDPASATPRQRLNWATNAADVYVTAVLLGRPKDVENALDAALVRFDIRRLPEVERPYFGIVRAYAAAGQPAKARAYLERYEAEVRDTALTRDQQSERASALADVLLAENKPAEAIVQIRRSDSDPDGPATACNICLSIGLARAFDMAGQTDSAATHYERVIVPYSFDRQVYDRFFFAPFSKRLGELYEQKGDRAKAAKYYRDFVNLWKGADPELQPQVAEVRRRLSRLADIEKPASR